MRQNIYSEDRSDSDKYFYDNNEIKELLSNTGIFGTITDNLKPASKEDDNNKVTDTWINGFPVQVRVQFTENMKKPVEEYHPTIRYMRLYQTTEVRKLIMMYEKKEKLPCLVWLLVDRGKRLIKKLIIVDLEKIIRSRGEKFEVDKLYKLTTDYQVIENKDNTTSFLILNNTDDYLYSYISDN